MYKNFIPNEQQLDFEVTKLQKTNSQQYQSIL